MDTNIHTIRPISKDAFEVDDHWKIMNILYKRFDIELFQSLAIRRLLYWVSGIYATKAIW